MIPGDYYEEGQLRWSEHEEGTFQDNINIVCNNERIMTFSFRVKERDSIKCYWYFESLLQMNRKINNVTDRAIINANKD